MDASLHTKSTTSPFCLDNKSSSTLSSLTILSTQYNEYSTESSDDLSANVSQISFNLYTFKEVLALEPQNDEEEEAISDEVGFCIYEHPLWKDWVAVMKQTPFIIDLNQTISQHETELQGALFRLYPKFADPLYGRTFSQGTIIEFKRFDNDTAHYVVEWCKKKDLKNAYLEVVATTTSGIPIPYNHPTFPTIILAIPVYLSNVPHSSTFVQSNTIPSIYNGKRRTSSRLGTAIRGFIERVGKYFTK
jgi:hypothetical protein